MTYDSLKQQAMNPFLPGDEYIPDGEPYQFGDRVYVYGSHDRFNGKIFCMNDYVCYSAPINDLGNWRYEGVIYKKKQDPRNKLGIRLMFAPDVAKGVDGKYYLYYGIDFTGIMGVAVADTPTGPFQFLHHICYPDGTLWGRKNDDSFPFDPGVLVDDDGKIYLYSGFYTKVPRVITGGAKLKFDGGYVLELEKDMYTIKTPEKLLFPKCGKGSFVGHEFFEASSIRKYEGIYYFVYSSRHNHELCYAWSKYPTKDFTYGGALISNGDIGIGNERIGSDDSVSINNLDNLWSNYIGNNHGGLLKLQDKYYIFYHRHTNRTSYARQACAQRLQVVDDIHFKQAMMTSCGLNDGALLGQGRYEARIACYLTAKEGTGRYDVSFSKWKYRKHPYFTQQEKDGVTDVTTYIANMRDGSTAGFKYFYLENLKEIRMEVGGKANGSIRISADADGKEVIAIIAIQFAVRSKQEQKFHEGNRKQNKKYMIGCTVKGVSGEKALYFTYEGEGYINFYGFELI